MVGSVALISVSTAIAQDGDAPAPKVTIAGAYTQEIIEEASFVGRGEAAAKTELIARVTGFLQNISVDDGSHVDAGQVLFLIEPDSYEAAVAARKADLAQAEANRDLAEIELDRKAQLVERDAAPQSELDVAEANAAVAEAQVAAAQAALTQAELDLSYTEITAPFDGRVGRIDVSPGAFLGASSGALATVVQQSPMLVTFSLSEPQLMSVLEQLDTDVEGLSSAGGSPDVFVELPGGTMLEEPGTIAFLDNQIDSSTGTISVRAEFQNERGLILDGAFVNVRIQALQPTISVMIPQSAVQRDQRGDFVLVVSTEGLVEQRYVTLGQQVETAVVVEDGMREGESVIVEGLQRVRPGVAVDAVLAGQPAEGN